MIHDSESRAIVEAIADEMRVREACDLRDAQIRVRRRVNLWGRWQWQAYVDARRVESGMEVKQ